MNNYYILIYINIKINKYLNVNLQVSVSSYWFRTFLTCTQIARLYGNFVLVFYELGLQFYQHSWAVSKQCSFTIELVTYFFSFQESVVVSTNLNSNHLLNFSFPLLNVFHFSLRRFPIINAQIQVHR